MLSEARLRALRALALGGPRIWLVEIYRPDHPGVSCKVGPLHSALAAFDRWEYLRRAEGRDEGTVSHRSPSCAF